MIYAIVVLVLLIIDQGVKYLTLLKIPMDATYHEFIPGIIDLIRVHNTGIAFSLFEDWDVRWPLVILAAVFAGLVAFLIARRTIRGMFGRWMAVIVIAGALGNAIDRAAFGYVIDMLHFEFFKSFPVFNVADIYVVVGGLAFCLYVIFHKEYNDGEPALEDGPEPARTVKRVRRELPPPLEDLELSPVSPEERAALKTRDSKPLPAKRPRPAPQPEPLRPAVEDFMNPTQPKAQPRQQRPAPEGARGPRPENAPTRPKQPRPAAGAEAERPARPAQPRQAAERPAQRRARPAAPEQARPRPAAARRPESPPETRTAPRRSADVDIDVPDFSLEDILAEFSDKN